MSFTLLGILNSQAEAAGGLAAYDLLETQVLSSSASSVTFTGLGSYSDYKHLQIRMVGRTNRSLSGNTVKINFNNDVTNSYARHELYGNGSSVASFASTSIPAIYSSTFDSTPDPAWGAQVVDILDFSNTNKNTTTRYLAGSKIGSSGNENVTLGSGAWFNTAAVTTITISTFSDSFISNSRFSLYGIK